MSKKWAEEKCFLCYLSHLTPFSIQGQFTEENILDNNENSPMFEEFLQLLGDKVRLRGFDKYKGGLGEWNEQENSLFHL